MNNRVVGLMAGALLVAVTVAILAGPFGGSYLPLARPVARGAILSLERLAPKERIRIEYWSSGCRFGRHWLFEMRGEAPRDVVAIDAGGSYGPGESASDRPSAIGVVEISEAEVRGLAQLLAFYRSAEQGTGSTTISEIRVEYYRGDRLIGVEMFVDRSSIENQIYRRDQDGLIDPRSGVTLEMVSLWDLARRAAEANQPPEPTRMLGTSAAEPPRVPSTRVAHL